MRLIANSQLRGEYGMVEANQQFDVADDTAHKLIKTGMARQAAPPTIEYETKVINPQAPMVSPRSPFRDVPVSNAEPANVATESDSLLPKANLSPGGTSYSGGRPGRSRPTAGR